MELDDQLPFAHPVSVFVIVCLNLSGLDGLIEQIVICQHGQGLQHSFQIVRIVEEYGFFRVLGGIFDIFPVDPDQLASGEHILAVYTQELFQGLLFAVRKPQKISVRSNPPVQIPQNERAGKAVRIFV